MLALARALGSMIEGYVRCWQQRSCNVKTWTLAALAVFFSAVPAYAQSAPADQFLCCPYGANLNAATCVPSATACAPAPYLVQFSDLQDNAMTEAFFGPNAPPDVLDASFPTGMEDATAWWQSGAPWQGVCLLAPSSADPMHENPTEPDGCFDFAVWPGVGAQALTITLQHDARWDAYQVCYGSPVNGACPASEPTASPLPVSGSCCAPANMLRDVTAAGQWQIFLSSGIPGVPEPNAAADAGLGTYNPEVSSSTGPNCKPKTCKSTGLTCANLDDGCGGTLSCVQGCKALAQACDAVPGTSSGPAASFLLACGLVAMARLRRRAA